MARRQIVSGNARVHQLAMLKGPSADIHVVQSALPPKKPKPTSGLAKPKPPKSQQTQASSAKQSRPEYSAEPAQQAVHHQRPETKQPKPASEIAPSNPFPIMPSFDPATMSMNDIQNIAENADNLIKIITTIKEKVRGPGDEDQVSAQPLQEKKLNFDIELSSSNKDFASSAKPERVSMEGDE